MCLTEVGFKPKANRLHHTDYRVYFNHIDSTPCTQRAKTKNQKQTNEGLDKTSKVLQKRIRSIRVIKIHNGEARVRLYKHSKELQMHLNAFRTGTNKVLRGLTPYSGVTL